MDKARPIIILKKKGGHGGHHGGAWKVAYADFVTAMMAFFLVLWLVSSAPKPVKEAIAGYFNDPSGSGSKTGTSMSGTGENLSVTRDDMPMLKEQLEQAMKKMPDFQNLHDHVEMTITSEGLRIELSESAVGTFFDSGSPKLNGDGKDMLILLAQQRRERRSGQTSAWLCRSATAQARRSSRPLQPPHFGYRAILAQRA
jgi:chemotaxis protein MotB